VRRGFEMSRFAAGLLVILAALSVTYLAFAKRLPWADDYEIRALFSSANELHSRSPVRIAGVDVGQVTRVQRGPGGTALVTMAIRDKGRPVHADATMKIRPRIFLEGNFFVDLRPGTGRAPELEEGQVVPLGQTATPVQLDEILSTLNSSTREQLQGLVRQYSTALEGGGAQALHDGYASWEGAFRGTAITAEALRGPAPHDLSELVAAQARVSGALAAHDRELAGLVTGFARTVGALAANEGAVAATVRELARLTRASPGALDALNDSFPAVRAFVADVRPALRAAPRTLDAAVPLLRQLDGALRPGEVPGLVADLRPALRVLERTQPRLIELFDLVRPVTDCVRENALPALTTPLDDGDLSTGQPPWQELLHGMVGLASASQNFDGNGMAVRYHGGYGDQLVSTGDVPGLGRLVGLSSEPPVGSRPPWPGPGNEPPFRPDVPCATQAPPDLSADVVPASAAGTAGAVARPPADVLAALQARLRGESAP